jgi:beta-1,4-mannosyltransferase
MRVTLFARVNPALNPYILLYRRALVRQGIVARLEREFGLKWLVTRGRSCEAIHLHWIEAAYKPARSNVRSNLVKRLADSRFINPLRAASRLADFSAALLLAKLEGKIIVYTVHNLEPHHEDSWPFGILNRLAHRVVLSLSDHVHAHNHYTRRTLENAYGRKDGVIVIPLGNYVGHYANQVSRLEARRQLGLPDDSFVYLFLGLVRPYKGLEELISAFSELELPMGRLLIVGRAPNANYKEKILSLSRDISTIEVVPEFVPDEAVQLYMNACDICVLPYRNITTSSAAVLAWSFGRPIVAPAITSFTELVTPQTGILYDPSQPNGLLLALRQTRQHPWCESEILDYVHQFDWDRLGPRLSDLYRI